MRFLLVVILLLLTVPAFSEPGDAFDMSAAFKKNNIAVFNELYLLDDVPIAFGTGEDFWIDFNSANTSLDIRDSIGGNLLWELLDTANVGFLRATGAVQAGTNDTQNGAFKVFGHSTGSGGQYLVYNAADEDTTYEYFILEADDTDLMLGTDVAGHAFHFYGPGDFELDGFIDMQDDKAIKFGSGDDILLDFDSGNTRLEWNDFSGNLLMHLTDTGTKGTLAVSQDITAERLGTGQGLNELYAMDQDVETTDAVVFVTLDTGQGANELFDMDQHVLVASSPTFVGLTLTGDLAVNGGDITSSTGAIAFGNENLSTTGTFASASLTTTGDIAVNGGDITSTSGAIVFGNENLSTTGTFSAGVGTFTGVFVGINDTTVGTLSSYGDGTGSSIGGQLELYNAADFDAAINLWRVDVFEDDLRIFPNTAANLWHFRADGSTETDGALSIGGNLDINTSESGNLDITGFNSSIDLSDKSTPAAGNGHDFRMLVDLDVWELFADTNEDGTFDESQIKVNINTDVLTVFTGGTQAFAIDGSQDIDFAGDGTFVGDVGIGTTAPSGALHLKSTTGEIKAILETTAADDIGIQFTQAVGSGNTWKIGLDNSDSSAFSFAYNASAEPSLTSNALLRLKTNGNLVLVGGLFCRQATDNLLDATAGTEGEIVYETVDNVLYVCTATGSPGTWAALH